MGCSKSIAVSIAGEEAVDDSVPDRDDLQALTWNTQSEISVRQCGAGTCFSHEKPRTLSGSLRLHPME